MDYCVSKGLLPPPIVDHIEADAVSDISMKRANPSGTYTLP